LVTHLAYSPAAKTGLLALAVELSGITGPDAGPRTRWIHVAPEGEWTGHAEGAFKLTKEHFACAIDVIRAKRTPCSVDYEHASVRPTGGPAPAAGFVLDAEIRDDGLWALVECTETSDGHIRKGEYRFCSGVFDFAAVDPVTNRPLLCVLDSIALTNRPFLDGQTPIACTSRPRAPAVALTSGASMSAKVTRKELENILDMFKLKEFTTAQLMKAIDFVASMKGGGAEDVAAVEAEAEESPAESADLSAKPAGAVALNAPAPEAAPTAAPVEAAPVVALADPPVDAPMSGSVDDFDAIIGRLSEAVGISDNAALIQAIVDNFDAIVAILKGEDAMAATAALSRSPIVGALQAQVVSLSTELGTFRKQAADAEQSAISTEIDAMVQRGQLHPGKRAEFATAMTGKKLAEVKALSALLPSTLPVKPHATALSAPVGGSESLSVEVDPTDAHAVELTKFLKAAGHKPGSPTWTRAMGAIPRA
jgi:phage I-like protein